MDANTNSLLTALGKFLSDDALLTKPEELIPFECDGLTALRERPLAVALPDKLEQIPQILKLCAKHNTPVVTRGAGTGLAGGARPSEDALLLGMSRFSRILSVDPERRTARVQPGITNLAISHAAMPYGLYYAPDPSSQLACTIGGNVAENSGGVHCLKYGLTVHNVIGLKIVLADGEEITLSGETLDMLGYDLLALMNGSEGMLGVITEVTVRLLPKPDLTRVILAAFDQVRVAGDAVGKILSAGILPGGLEMMDKRTIEAAEAFANAGYPTDATAILLCEIDGSETEVNLELQNVEAILREAGATDIRVSQSEEENAKFWAGRKNAFPAIGRVSPDYYVMDGTIPRRKLGEVLEQIEALSQHFGLTVANVFHAGDGNLHPLVLYDANAGELEKAEQFGTEILKLCIDAGGVVTGEHGVGVEKLDAMCHQFDSPELKRFHAIKAVFDPTGMLNPGKAIPTLHRCAELGAMHVHHGHLPHPELERF